VCKRSYFEQHSESESLLVRNKVRSTLSQHPEPSDPKQNKQQATLLSAEYNKQRSSQCSPQPPLTVSNMSRGSTILNHCSKELWEFNGQTSAVNYGALWHTWLKHCTDTLVLNQYRPFCCIRRFSVKTILWCYVNIQNVLLGVCAIIWISIKVRHVEKGS
jgi:hypothetical protein